MAKVKFTRENIVNATYDLMKQEGMKNISARKIAKKLKGSTAPIYAHFSNLEIRFLLVAFRLLCPSLTRRNRKEVLFVCFVISFYFKFFTNHTGSIHLPSFFIVYIISKKS